MVVLAKLLDSSWGTPTVGTHARRSRSISDVSSFNAISVLSFDPIRVSALLGHAIYRESYINFNQVTASFA